MADEAEGSSLFAVFALSILSLFLIPWTIYKFCAIFNAPTSIESVSFRGNFGICMCEMYGCGV